MEWYYNIINYKEAGKMENAAKKLYGEVIDYQPSIPEVIKMTETICSMKILEILKEAEANYMFVEREAFKVIGRRCTTPEGGGAWRAAREDGTIVKMEKLETGNPFLGLCFGFNSDGSNDNMVAVEYDAEVEGLESFLFPAHKWLVYTLSGKTSDDLLGDAWWHINNKLMSEFGIKKDNLPTMEVYLEWDNEHDKCSVEICIPYIEE
jgi:AraC family transcriptional regulator